MPILASPPFGLLGNRLKESLHQFVGGGPGLDLESLNLFGPVRVVYRVQTFFDSRALEGNRSQWEAVNIDYG